jgi:transposase
MGRLSPEQRELAKLAGLSPASLKKAKANRVGRLRGFGNAIVPQEAAEFVASFLDIEQQRMKEAA